MVITRTMTTPDENLLSNMLNSAVFRELIENIVKTRTCELINLVSELKNDVKNLRDSNIELVKLLTNNRNFNWNDSNINDGMHNSLNVTNISCESVDLNKTLIDKKHETEKSDKNKKPQQDDFEYVFKNRKQRRTIMRNKESENNKNFNNKVIIGSNSDETNNNTFGAADKQIWIYVGRCKIGTESETINSYLQRKCPGKTFNVESLQSKGHPSFKIGANPDLEETLYQSSFWPKGILIKRFLFFPSYRRQQTRRTDTDREF